MMTHRIELLKPKKLLGMSMEMCFAQHAPHLIWQQFMPRKKEIAQLANHLLYSLEVYPDEQFFRNFSMDAKFEKWAAVEVNNYEQIPAGMKPLELKEGSYAVFNFKGKSSEAKAAYDYIFLKWLPTSGYELAHLPHFALMGEKYKHDDPDSEEEIWIPVVE
jgi:AraC family transcriptional regulator